MTTQQPEPQQQPHPQQEQHEQPGVVITDDYVTPSVPRLVAEDNDMLDEARTSHEQDDATPDSFTSAVPAMGGGLVGSPTTITDPTDVEDGDLDEDGNRTER